MSDVPIEACTCGDFHGQHSSGCPYGEAHGLVFYSDTRQGERLDPPIDYGELARARVREAREAGIIPGLLPSENYLVVGHDEAAVQKRIDEAMENPAAARIRKHIETAYPAPIPEFFSDEPKLGEWTEEAIAASPLTVPEIIRQAQIDAWDDGLNAANDYEQGGPSPENPYRSIT